MGHRTGQCSSSRRPEVPQLILEPNFLFRGEPQLLQVSARHGRAHVGLTSGVGAQAGDLVQSDDVASRRSLRGICVVHCAAEGYEHTEGGETSCSLLNLPSLAPSFA